MTDTKRVDDLANLVREVRQQYDALPASGRAVLNRCRTADDLRAEGAYWRLVDDAEVPVTARYGMAHVVACFGAAEAAKPGQNHEPFARWLRRTVYGDVSWADLPSRAVRVRRLLAARDRDELVHELGRLLRHAWQKSRRGVDWGPLGAGVLRWGGRGIDGVRRRWAEEFFTEPLEKEPSANHHPEESTDARSEDR